MTEARTLTEGDIEALCEALVPKLEARLADRFYANAGRGLLGWAAKLLLPVFWACVLYGMVVSTPTVSRIVTEIHKP